MIRIRFFGPRELNQNGFRAAQYFAEDLFVHQVEVHPRSSSQQPSVGYETKGVSTAGCDGKESGDLKVEVGQMTGDCVSFMHCDGEYLWRDPRRGELPAWKNVFENSCDRGKAFFIYSPEPMRRSDVRLWRRLCGRPKQECGASQDERSGLTQLISLLVLGTA